MVSNILRTAGEAQAEPAWSRSLATADLASALAILAGYG